MWSTLKAILENWEKVLSTSLEWSRKLVSSKNTKRYLICLGLATSLWLLIKLSKKYTYTLDFFVSAKNIPTHFSLVDQSDQKVQISLRTYGFDLLKLKIFGTPNISIPTAYMEVFNSSYVWKTSQFRNEAQKFFNGGEVFGVYPDTVSFAFRRKVSKKVPIDPGNINLSYSSGYFQLEKKIKLYPDSVKITGLSEAIDKIHSISTEKFTAENLKEDLHQELHLIPSKGVILEIDKTTLKKEIRLFTELKMYIPIQPIALIDSLKAKFYPSEIEVHFLVSVDSATVPQVSDFRLVCNMEDFQSKKLLPITVLNRPPYIRNINYKPKEVEFLISPK